jgi:TonB family protein
MLSKQFTFVCALVFSVTAHSAALALLGARVLGISNPSEHAVTVSIERMEQVGVSEGVTQSPARFSERSRVVREVKQPRPAERSRELREAPSEGAGAPTSMGQAHSRSDLEPTLYDAALLGISPAYPLYARRHHQEGRVVCRITFAAVGKASDVAVVTGSGFKALDDAAVDALERAQLDVASLPTRTDLLVAFSFRLQDTR